MVEVKYCTERTCDIGIGLLRVSTSWGDSEIQKKSSITHRNLDMQGQGRHARMSFSSQYTRRCTYSHSLRNECFVVVLALSFTDTSDVDASRKGESGRCADRLMTATPADPDLLDLMTRPLQVGLRVG